MDCTIFQTEGNNSSTFSVFHDQIQGEIFNEIMSVVLQRLQVKEINTFKYNIINISVRENIVSNLLITEDGKIRGEKHTVDYKTSSLLALKTDRELKLIISSYVHI